MRMGLRPLGGIRTLKVRRGNRASWRSNNRKSNPETDAHVLAAAHKNNMLAGLEILNVARAT